MGVWRLRILFAEMIEFFEGFPKAKLLCTAEALQMVAVSVRRPGAYCICEKRCRGAKRDRFDSVTWQSTRKSCRTKIGSLLLRRESLVKLLKFAPSLHTYMRP